MTPLIWTILTVLLWIYLIIGVLTTALELWMGRENISVLLIIMALLDGFYPPFTIGFHVAMWDLKRRVNNSNNGR